MLKLKPGLLGGLVSHHGGVSTTTLAHGPEGTAALTDGSTEKPLAQWRGTEHTDRDASSRLAGYRHLFGVATKGGDVVVNPLQGHHLVLQAIVAGNAAWGLLAECRVRQEAKHAEAVLDAAIDDALAHETLLCAAIGASSECTAVYHHKDGEFFTRCLGGCLHAQVKAVLTHGYLVAVLVGVDGLWRPRAPAVGTIYARPRFFRHWSLPSQLTDGGLGVWDVHIQGMSLVLHSLYLSLRHGGAQQLRLDGRCHQQHGDGCNDGLLHGVSICF